MKRRTILPVALASTLVVLAGVAGFTDVADSAPQAAPSNQSPPAVSGTPEEGKTLTTSDGTWTGTAPITFAYSWRRCDEDGGSCSQIGGASEQDVRPQEGRRRQRDPLPRDRAELGRLSGRDVGAVGSDPRRLQLLPSRFSNGNAPIPIARACRCRTGYSSTASRSIRRWSAVRRGRSRFASASPARGSPSRARSSTPKRSRSTSSPLRRTADGGGRVRDADDEPCSRLPGDQPPAAAGRSSPARARPVRTCSAVSRPAGSSRSRSTLTGVGGRGEPGELRRTLPGPLCLIEAWPTCA